MYSFSVDAGLLIALVAGLLALAFDYFPKVNQWFDGLDTATKRQLNAGLILGTAILIYAGQCLGLFITNLVCTMKGAFDLLYIVFLTITINQGVHLALKPTPAFKARMFGK